MFAGNVDIQHILLKVSALKYKFRLPYLYWCINAVLLLIYL